MEMVYTHPLFSISLEKEKYYYSAINATFAVVLSIFDDTLLSHLKIKADSVRLTHQLQIGKNTTEIFLGFIQA